jgi:D-alanyl-D-alanine carboxypeptidase
MARVRQVLVAPATADESAGAPRPPSIEALLDEPAMVRDNAIEQVPPPQQPRWVTASAGGPRMPASAPSPDKAAPGLDYSDARGSPPSTLDDHAASLARTPAPVAAPPAKTARAPTPAKTARAPTPQPASPAIAGGFQIQIGAYQTEAEAQRQLALARERAPNLVGGRTALTQQVKQGDKLFYRARYAGFDAQPAAAQACSELKRLKIDCIVLKAE